MYKIHPVRVVTISWTNEPTTKYLIADTVGNCTILCGILQNRADVNYACHDRLSDDCQVGISVKRIMQENNWSLELSHSDFAG